METIREVPEISFEDAQKILQQQLILILHAHGCQRKELCQRLEPEDGRDKVRRLSFTCLVFSSAELVHFVFQCKLPFCEDMKQVLDHIRCCFELEGCSTPHCRSTRDVIHHWKICVKKSTCQVCKPVYQAQTQVIKESLSNRQRNNSQSKA